MHNGENVRTSVDEPHRHRWRVPPPWIRPSDRSKSAPAPIAIQVGVSWQDAVDGLVHAGEVWDDQGTEWVASGGVAAAVMAPLLTSVRTALVFVGAHTVPGLETVAAQIGLSPVQGGRLTLSPFPTTTTRTLSTTVGGLRTAPWPRVFADLQTLGVRGEEAAEHLREVADR